MTANDNRDTNFDHLLQHLDDHSLAAELVRAYRESPPAAAATRLRDVLRAHLQEQRKALETPSD